MGGPPFQLLLVQSESGETILGGGRSDTTECTNYLSASSAVSCADITLTITYEISGHEGVKQSKDFRSATRMENHLFKWHEVSAGTKGSVCVTAAKEEHG